MNKKKKNQLKSASNNPKSNQKTVTQNSQPPNAPKMITLDNFSLKIEMLSDWHIGSGAGIPGGIDRLILRDQNNLPYLPAKTITGIWRDACESVAMGLDCGDPKGIWSQWVIYLFGDQPALEQGVVDYAPREAALSVRSAHFEKQFVDAIANKPQLIEAITFVKPGISIDPENGCARQDFLRFEEMVRAGAVLESSCQLDFKHSEKLDLLQKQMATALLVAGTVFIERLGGKRRRGAGKCKWQINGQDINISTNWIEKNLTTIPVPPQLSQEDDLKWSNSIPNTPTWVKVDLTVTTLSPLIIPQGTVGNVVATLDYIPGTYLMRLITKKLKSLNFDFSNAIAHGKLIVTNATIEIAGTAGKPTPFALFGEKLSGGLAKLKDGGKVYNRFIEEDSTDQLKGERGGYVNFSNSQIDYSKISTGIETHNTVKDESQRPTSDIGGVYSYETILIGTTFRAELRLPQDLADELSGKHRKWWEKISGDSDRLGQSKKDDYGLVKMEAEEPQSIAARQMANNNLLTVWVLSDILLRDQRLRPTTSFKALQKELEAKLDVKLELRKNVSPQYSGVKSYSGLHK